MKREEIIEVLNKHCHSMAGHTWLIGIDKGDFESIADELQTKELSDEEIYLYVKENCKSSRNYSDDFRLQVNAIKWYREQIK